MHPIVADLLVAAGIILMLLVSFEVAFRAGRRAAAERDPSASGQLGAIQGAILGLLGLLLGFSFAAAGARFIEKQDLIVHEANAIGTAYLRADLLDEPFSSELRETLRQYTALRVEASARLRYGLTPGFIEENDRLHERLWSVAHRGVKERPASTVAVVQSVNEVIDLHALRLAAVKKHLPGLVLGLLMGSSVLAVGVIAYGCGLGGHRRMPMTIPLILVIGTALWITVDLDHPRSGLMQLSDAPLKGLKFNEATAPADGR